MIRPDTSVPDRHDTAVTLRTAGYTLLAATLSILIAGLTWYAVAGTALGAIAAVLILLADEVDQ